MTEFSGSALHQRHLPLDGFGADGIARLRSASVLVLGAGGLGSGVLPALAGAGIGRLLIVDCDTVSESNLNRQFLYTTADVGQSKARVAALRISKLNREVETVFIESRAGREEFDKLLGGIDLALDCSDNFPTRFDLSFSCLKAGVPLVSASAQGWGGQLFTQLPQGEGGCLRCLFPDGKICEDAPLPEQSGVLGSVCEVMSGLQATEAIRILLGLEPSYAESFLDVNLSRGRFSTIARLCNPECPVCGS